jgi:sulfide:quinone oxidoreductase
MSRDTSKSPDGLRVLIVGGGVAGLETMLALRAIAEERVDIELVAPEPHFWYRPLAVAEPFLAGRAGAFELASVASACRARFTLGALASVEPERHIVRTANGLELPYDVLVLALGARPEPALTEGLTFRGPADVGAFTRLLFALEEGEARSLVFAIPSATAWPLPAYELALMTAKHLGDRADEVDLALVTPERRPLALFGTAASDAIERLLEERGIVLHAGKHAVAAAGGILRLAPTGELPFDRLVSLPRLRGQPIPGIPHDRHGFVSTDESGGVRRLDDVYAAGDITSFPVKQGGIAAQQADTVAESVAARAGAPIRPQPFRPILRGLLLTGGAPAYLRSEIAGGRGQASTVAAEPLWWPPAKIVGRYLAPFLAEHVGLTAASVRPADPCAVVVEVALKLATGNEAAVEPGSVTPVQVER